MAREVGVFALGVLSGMLFSRMGAPIAARTAGTLRARAGGPDAFDELTADHKRILAACDQAERANGPARMAMFLIIKRELSKHAVAEEDVLYPLIADTLGSQADAMRLYEEHGEVKRLLAEVEDSLENDDELRYRDRIRALRDNVRRHGEDEESRWFPRLKERLDAKKRALVTGKIDREKALLA